MMQPPIRCPRGHLLRPDRTLIRAIACSCGWHTTWRCYCGQMTYGSALTQSCSLRDEPADLTQTPTSTELFAFQ
jgi:hypothetical protein